MVPHLEKGEEIETGHVVLVIEAMKMQSEYKVKKTCTIKDILVKEGDAINSDQTLITLN